MKETGTGDPTPEQLLQILGASLTARRSQSATTGRNRAIFLIGGLVFILVAAGVALLVLDQMLSDYRQRERPPQAEAIPARGNF